VRETIGPKGRPTTAQGFSLKGSQPEGAALG